MGGSNQTQRGTDNKEISKEGKNSSQLDATNAGMTQLERSLGFIYINKIENYTGRIRHISKVAVNTMICFENYERTFWCSGEDLTQDFQVGDMVYIDYKVMIAHSSKQLWITSIEIKKD